MATEVASWTLPPGQDGKMLAIRGIVCCLYPLLAPACMQGANSLQTVYMQLATP